MIAITFALPEESKDLRRKLSDARRAGATKAGPILTGVLAGSEVVVCHTGVGSEAARQETRALIQQFSPKLLVSSGFAGGLSPSLKVGDVVFDARGTILNGLDTLLPRCVSGAITTHESVIETPADKSTLARDTGAIAVDMESSAIAAACAEANVPMVVIRGISDAAGDPLPVPMEHWFDQARQRPKPFALVRFLASHPGRIRPFVRFLSSLPLARAAMTAAIEAFLEENFSAAD